MTYKKPMQGIDSSVYAAGHEFIMQREAAGVKIPRKKAKKDPEADKAINTVKLDGEDEGLVPIYDTCDDLRVKINRSLREDGVTQAGFARELTKITPASAYKYQYTKFKGEKPDRKIAAGHISRFLKAKGSIGGAENSVYYAGYIFFEKLRVMQGKEKSKKREEMEALWGRKGVNRWDARRGFLCTADNIPWVDSYGNPI